MLNRENRFYRLPLLVIGLILILLPADARAGGEPSLLVREPVVEQGSIRVEYLFENLFGDEIRRSLQSGLPATLLVRWTLWQVREGWWDTELLSGSRHFRIFYDLLEERYDVIDDLGQQVISCNLLREVERALQERGGLSIDRLVPLVQDRRYCVKLNLDLRPLDARDIREMDGWLRGERGSGQSRSALREISRRARGVINDVGGLPSTSIDGKSPPFPGDR
jgi:hypothetical protein